MIYLTARNRRVAICGGRELREWCPTNRAGQVLVTPDPQALSGEAERSPGVIMPWLRVIMRTNGTVPYDTELVFGQ